MDTDATKKNTSPIHIASLMEEEGNDICVDCLREEPLFADITHGVFVCKECAIIHEELHFVVKSIAMNSFDECDMEVLAMMGNRRCNAHYMARFSVNDWDLLDLPSEMDDGRMLLRSKMRVFVEEKYVHKRWLESDGQQRYSQHESSVGR